MPKLTFVDRVEEQFPRMHYLCLISELNYNSVNHSNSAPVSTSCEVWPMQLNFQLINDNRASS